MLAQHSSLTSSTSTCCKRNKLVQQAVQQARTTSSYNKLVQNLDIVMRWCGSVINFIRFVVNLLHSLLCSTLYNKSTDKSK